MPFWNKKGKTNMTSSNDCNKKVRQQIKKSGKILGKNPVGEEKQPRKPVGQIVHLLDIYKSQESQVSAKNLQPRKLVVTITTNLIAL